MSKLRKRPAASQNGPVSAERTFAAPAASSSFLDSLPVGALDNEDHWWLPPSHVRADLRTTLSSASWNRTIVLFSFLLLTFVLSELIATILEPIFPPRTKEEKFFFGVVLLGSDTIGAIMNLFLAAELWGWTLAFGLGWWGNLGNMLEVVSLCADFGCRMQYTGPIESSRCLHLLVCVWWGGLMVDLS